MLLTLLGIAMLCHAHSQTVPNQDFENWTRDSFGSDSLIGWSSSNNALDGSAPAWLYQTESDLNKGTYAAILGSVAFGYARVPVAGILVNGNAYIEHQFLPRDKHIYRYGGGSPVTRLPDAVQGFTKYSFLDPQKDSGLLVVFTTRYNAINNTKDTISKDSLLFLSHEEQEEFTLRLNRRIRDVEPDTITMIFYASMPDNPKAYSQLVIDSLRLVSYPNAGVSAAKNTAALKIYPNPGTGWVRISAEREYANARVTVSSSTSGKKMIELDHQQVDKDFSMDVSGLPDGVYICTVEAGKEQMTTVFTVKK